MEQCHALFVIMKLCKLQLSGTVDSAINLYILDALEGGLRKLTQKAHLTKCRTRTQSKKLMKVTDQLLVIEWVLQWMMKAKCKLIGLTCIPGLVLIVVIITLKTCQNTCVSVRRKRIQIIVPFTSLIVVVKHVISKRIGSVIILIVIWNAILVHVFLVKNLLEFLASVIKHQKTLLANSEHKKNIMAAKIVVENLWSVLTIFVKNFATRANVHLAKKAKYYLVIVKKKKLKLSEELLVFHVIKYVGRH
jgi:hypothetical protein